MNVENRMYLYLIIYLFLHIIACQNKEEKMNIQRFFYFIQSTVS